MADADSLLHRRRRAREDVSRARFQLRLQIGLGLLWVVLAVLRWTEDDGSDWLDWGWTVLSLAYLGVGLACWRTFRRERAQRRRWSGSTCDRSPRRLSIGWWWRLGTGPRPAR
ncbi:hypothetical protein [Blastococcus saxobsidens]|uniref:Uncharacterized protein n=1 Tax=Blastococcus saxobsidens (strain DD2) TaxID=1146883 RepID=H6RUP0_BLASD|nr:hypothetical protein [Blastococcus saxobsidens]CCG03207.1 protein of unknown function [Blastococcus saxobsidens DD2]